MPVLSYYFKHHLPKLNYIDDLKKIQYPTLLMAGEISVMHPPIRAQEMAELINPNLVTMHLFKNAGAAVYKDSPEESEKVVRKFLEKLVKK